MICQFLHEWHVNAAKKGDFVQFCWIFQNARTPFRENKKNEQDRYQPKWDELFANKINRLSSGTCAKGEKRL